MGVWYLIIFKFIKLFLTFRFENHLRFPINIRTIIWVSDMLPEPGYAHKSQMESLKSK